MLTGAERHEYYGKQAAANPDSDEFPRKTTRIVPVIGLRRVDA